MNPAMTLALLALTFFCTPVFARDEYWTSIQARTGLSDQSTLTLEYAEKDQQYFFESKKQGLVRLSYQYLFQPIRLVLGGTYLSNTVSADERRLHQYGLYNHQIEKFASIFYRFGLEERFFIADSKTYLRARARVQINPLPEYSFGLSLYNEAFYIPNGYQKFSHGFNENRFGVGLRYLRKNFETYLYFTEADLKGRTAFKHAQWIQLQVLYVF